MECSAAPSGGLSGGNEQQLAARVALVLVYGELAGAWFDWFVEEAAQGRPAWKGWLTPAPTTNYLVKFAEYAAHALEDLNER